MSSMLGASGLLRRVAIGAGVVAATLLMMLATGPGLAPAFAQGGERPPSQVTVCVQKALADQLESGSVDLGAIAAECNVSIEEVKENIHPSQLPGQYDDDSEDSPSSQYEDDAASDQYDNGVTPSQYEDDSTGDVSAGSSSDGSGGGLSVLPDTGGASLLALGVGALLVAGGLLARRIVR